MTLQELFDNVGEIGDISKDFLKAFAKFIDVLAENNIEIDFTGSETSENVIDYESPASESYKKTYKPITASEITKANKEMSEAIAGEKWVEGFIACVQLMLLAK